jgi:ACS family tartrate transporter-like MFS transporter
LTETSAAVSIGLINSIGNLGGFIGPTVVGYLKTSTGSYDSGSIFMVASLLVAAFLILALKKTKESEVQV